VLSTPEATENPRFSSILMQNRDGIGRDLRGGSWLVSPHSLRMRRGCGTVRLSSRCKPEYLLESVTTAFPPYPSLIRMGDRRLANRPAASGRGASELTQVPRRAERAAPREVCRPGDNRVECPVGCIFQPRRSGGVESPRISLVKGKAAMGGNQAWQVQPSGSGTRTSN
jgi:hypothetical protein